MNEKNKNRLENIFQGEHNNEAFACNQCVCTRLEIYLSIDSFPDRVSLKKRYAYIFFIERANQPFLGIRTVNRLLWKLGRTRPFINWLID